MVGEGVGSEVPKGGSERGGRGGWGAEGRSEPFEGSQVNHTPLAETVVFVVQERDTKHAGVLPMTTICRDTASPPLVSVPS